MDDAGYPLDRFVNTGKIGFEHYIPISKTLGTCSMGAARFCRHVIYGWSLRVFEN